MNNAISIQTLTKRYGGHVALDDVSFEVSEGSVCGLLGQNGAGKTTTIRTMLDLLRPTAGRVEVLGLDSVRDSVEIRRRVGYLAEEPGGYPWMTVDEIIRFNSRFFPGWDDQLSARLLDRLALPRDRRLRDLSRGMRAKVTLVMAMAQRPDLLLLDDPTSGLDPIARREFLEAMIENVQSDGGTVLFSTHLVHEMERIADEVAMLHRGRLLLRGSVEGLKASHRRIRAIFRGPVAELRAPGLVRVEQLGHHALFVTDRFDDELPAALASAGFDQVEVMDMDLEEIFIETVRRASPDAGLDQEPPAPSARAAA